MEYSTINVELPTETCVENATCSCCISRPMTSSLEFPSVYPGGWNVPVLLQYLPVIINVQRVHPRKNQQKRIVKKAFR